METSVPVKKITLQTIAEEIKPSIERQETEDQKIAVLSGQAPWDALKERIQRKMAAVEESAKVTSNTIGLVDDVALFGFKCMAKDLLIEAYQGIIDDVEVTANFLNEKKKDEQSKLPIESGKE